LRRLLFAVCACLIATSALAAEDDEAVYLRRFAESGAKARDTYDPMEAVPGAARVDRLALAPGRSISAAALDKARAYAAANNSQALLIWRDGALEEAAYFNGASRDTPLLSRSMAKPLAAIAVGRAIQLGKIRSLDQPVADFIPEWRGTPKGQVKVRHLLDMTAGFLEQGFSSDASNIWSRAYLHPRHDRILLEEYPLTDTPGTVYSYANATADMVALLIERATGMRYGEFLSREVLAPLGAAGGEVWVDRPGGLAHSGCCILLPAETWLKLGLLLLDDGVRTRRRLLPAGYVAAMRTPTAANPHYGLGVWSGRPYAPRRGFGKPGQALGAVLQSEPFVDEQLFFFDGAADQVLYIAPSKGLAILRMGGPPPKSPEWDNAMLPNLILRDLGAGRR
jgi:CubicO group peptidase (beta-lactamase class C family)